MHGDNNPLANRVNELYTVEPRKLPSGHWKGWGVRDDLETGKRHELLNQTFDSKSKAKQWADTEAGKYCDDLNREPPSEETLGSYLI